MNEHHETRLCAGTREACPYRGEILESVNYQKQSIAILTRLETKMDLIIGQDGNNGRLGTVEDEIDSLKQDRSRDKGFFAAIGVVWTVLLVAMEWVWGRK